MISPSIPRGETIRLVALRASGLMGLPDDYALDCLTNVGARLFGVPICALTLVDANRQWFASCVGLEVNQTPRDISFCGHVVANRRPEVVEDTARDVRFADNPLVTGEPRVRFYAGYPIQAASGEVLGSLCLMDTRPREFPPRQLALLRELAVLAQLALAARQNGAVKLTPALDADLTRRQTMIDPLLRIWNHDGIVTLIEQSLQISVPHREPLSVLMIDIDHFSRVNESHGRAVGDRVMKAITRQLRAELRATDNVGRIGGDAFLVVQPNTTAVAAARAARRIYESISALRTELPTNANGCTISVSCTVSIGIAEWQTGLNESAPALVQRARMALHAVVRGDGDYLYISAGAEPPTVEVTARLA